MHVAPADLRTLSQDGTILRFAMLGSMAYVLVEIPEGGSAGTSMEQPCARPHWGFVIDGTLSLEAAGRSTTILPGRAFYVPAGNPEHRLITPGRARIAGFEPVDAGLDVSDAALAAQGFESLATRSKVTVAPAMAPRDVPAGRIQAETWPMPPYAMTRFRMGSRSGYTSGWCDAQHWGLVIDGRVAIEWEHDIEILVAGDVFHCPAGPPGHRFEATDPATVVDLTPIHALTGGGRLAEWRRAQELVSLPSPGGIAVTALA